MIDASKIAEHAEVIGADGAHVGTVDGIEGDRIKLTKKDAGEGHHKGHHHFIPLSLVAEIEDGKVRLTKAGNQPEPSSFQAVLLFRNSVLNASF